MSLTWPPPDDVTLRQAMPEHPAETNRCVELGRIVLDVARKHDAEARALQVLPKGPRARFVIPKRPLPRSWSMHVLTETRAHDIDAFTGSRGCERESYLETHWQHVDWLRVVPVDLATLAGAGAEDE
jgi:hypothetical protein